MDNEIKVGDIYKLRKPKRKTHEKARFIVTDVKDYAIELQRMDRKAVWDKWYLRPEAVLELLEPVVTQVTKMQSCD